MPELLTTDEAAEYLRLSERKLYELVAERAGALQQGDGALAVSRAALDRWVSAGLIAPAALAQVAAPPIVGGSHDPLLEWALRESHSGLAACRRQRGRPAAADPGEVMIAAIHLHRLDGDDETANLDSVADTPRVARCRRALLRTARARHSGCARQSAG
jgi:excisionase family DNA binding protein